MAAVELPRVKGYDETAKAVLEFRSILEESQVPADTLKKILNLLDVHQSEFAGSHTFGKVYRKDRFEEVELALLAAVYKMGAKFAPTILPLYPSLVRLMEARETISGMGEETRRGVTKLYELSGFLGARFAILNRHDAHKDQADQEHNS